MSDLPGDYSEQLARHAREMEEYYQTYPAARPPAAASSSRQSAGSEQAAQRSADRNRRLVESYQQQQQPAASSQQPTGPDPRQAAYARQLEEYYQQFPAARPQQSAPTLGTSQQQMTQAAVDLEWNRAMEDYYQKNPSLRPPSGQPSQARPSENGSSSDSTTSFPMRPEARQIRTGPLGHAANRAEVGTTAVVRGLERGATVAANVPSATARGLERTASGAQHVASAATGGIMDASRQAAGAFNRLRAGAPPEPSFSVTRRGGPPQQDPNQPGSTHSSHSSNLSGRPVADVAIDYSPPAGALHVANAASTSASSNSTNSLGSQVPPQELHRYGQRTVGPASSHGAVAASMRDPRYQFSSSSSGSERSHEPQQQLRHKNKQVRRGAGG
jgi:hypothetical protein